MTGWSVSMIVVVFIATLLLSSKFFYILGLKSFTKRLAMRNDLNILELSYSFEQMVYFIPLPSNLPIIKNATKEDISIDCDYTSLLFPRLSGIKIYIQGETESLILAYLPIKDFRLPTLDQMLEQGKIDGHSYLKISTYKLIHPNTLKEISDEVFKQIQA
jgi:hypothetical protein